MNVFPPTAAAEAIPQHLQRSSVDDTVEEGAFALLLAALHAATGTQAPFPQTVASAEGQPSPEEGQGAIGDAASGLTTAGSPRFVSEASAEGLECGPVKPSFMLRSASAPLALGAVSVPTTAGHAPAAMAETLDASTQGPQQLPAPFPSAVPAEQTVAATPKTSAEGALTPFALPPELSATGGVQPEALRSREGQVVPQDAARMDARVSAASLPALEETPAEAVAGDAPPRISRIEAVAGDAPPRFTPSAEVAARSWTPAPLRAVPTTESVAVQGAATPATASLPRMPAETAEVLAEVSPPPAEISVEEAQEPPASAARKSAEVGPSDSSEHAASLVQRVIVERNRPMARVRDVVDALVRLESPARTEMTPPAASPGEQGLIITSRPEQAAPEPRLAQAVSPATHAPERSSLENLPRDMVRSVRYLVTHEASSMKLRLVPESLGEVRVEVVHRGTELSVRLHALDPVVRDTLEAHAGHLRETLQREGLGVGRVEVGAPDTGAQQSAGRGAGHADESAARAYLRGLRLETNAPVNSPDTSRLPVRRVREHLGTLNVFV